MKRAYSPPRVSAPQSLSCKDLFGILMNTHPARMVSASEVEKFAYCPMNWWLSRVSGEETDPESEKVLSAGVERHSEHAEKAFRVKTHQEKVKVSEAIVLAWSVAATVCALMGVVAILKEELMSRIIAGIALIWLLAGVYALYRSIYLEGSERHAYEKSFLILAALSTIAAILCVEFILPANMILGRIFEAIAIIWLAGAVTFTYKGIIHEYLASQGKMEISLRSNDEVAYIDAPSSPGDLIVSEKYGIRGRPDMILKYGNEIIPVEKKTGRTPRGPLFSHIVQVGAYCLLLEEKYGNAVTHGIISYNETRFPIPYDDNLKAIVLEFVEKIRKAELSPETPPVHRNHNRPGKCAGCSRKTSCPERIK